MGDARTGHGFDRTSRRSGYLGGEELAGYLAADSQQHAQTGRVAPPARPGVPGQALTGQAPGAPVGGFFGNRAQQRPEVGPVSGAAPGDPNANGGNGQRPWRWGGWGGGGVAPIFRPPAPEPAPAAEPGRQQPGTAGGGASQSDHERQLANVERALAPQTRLSYLGFAGQMAIGGTAGVLGGGPLARVLDRATKSYLANPDRACVPSLGGAGEAALWYQRTHGLAGAEEALQPLFDRDRQLATRMTEYAEAQLEPEAARINADLPGRALAGMSEAERQALARYRLLSGRPLPDGVAGSLPDADLRLLEEHADLGSRIQEIRAGMSTYRASELQELTAADARLEARLRAVISNLEPAGRPALERLNTLGAAALSPAELAAARKYRFFSEFAADATRTPRDCGVQSLLSAEELGMVTHRQQVKGRILEIEPHVRAQADLPALMLRQQQVERQISGIADGLKAQAEPLEQRLSRAPQSFLTAEERLLLSRYEFLKAGGLGPAPEGWQNAPAAERDLVRQRQLLRQRYRFLGSGAEYNGTVSGILSQEERALLAERAGINAQLSRLGRSGLRPRGMLRNFATGVAAVGLGEFIDDRLDGWLFGGMKTRPSWYTDTLAVPAAMLIPFKGNWFLRGAQMTGSIVGAHVAGKILDSLIPAPADPTWNRYLRPTGWESAGAALGAVLPLRNESLTWRAAYTLGGWAIGKAVGAAFARPEGREIRDQAFALFSADKSTRSSRSMQAAIDKFKELSDLGTAQEMVVKFYRDDWLRRQHDDLLSGYRGAAIVLAAVGESRLDKGTFIPGGQGEPSGGRLNRIWRTLSGSGSEYDSILQGYNLDLGGDALSNLISARIQIERARTATQAILNHDPSYPAARTPVTGAEVAGLSDVQARIDADIQRVYARHDIPAIYAELESWSYRKMSQAARIADHQRAMIRQPPTNDPRYLAKLYRDLALIDLAFAGYKVGYNGVGNGRDAIGARGPLQEALGCLGEARRLDGGNEDTDQIAAIADAIAAQAPGMEQGQLRSPLNNPFGTDGRPTPAQRPPGQTLPR